MGANKSKAVKQFADAAKSVAPRINLEVKKPVGDFSVEMGTTAALSKEARGNNYNHNTELDPKILTEMSKIKIVSEKKPEVYCSVLSESQENTISSLHDVRRMY